MTDESNNDPAPDEGASPAAAGNDTPATPDTSEAATTADASGDRPRMGALKAIGLVVLLVGGSLSLVAFLAEGGQKRFGYAYMLGFAFAWAIVVGSLFFVSLQHATRSVWSVVLRRVPEMLASPMWVLALLFIPLLAFALLSPDDGIFKWIKPEGDHAHVIEKKAPYLNESFFIIRTIAFFVIWAGFTWFFVGGSVRQDEGRGGVATTKRMQAVSGPFIIIFGLTVTFASFDWLMSLEPHWFSTIYGVYVFGGIILSALAAITLLIVLLQAHGHIPKGLLRRDHWYSLGALMFAFSCFWAYIAFSQFMLIWYGNLPEETVYYTDRMKGSWLHFSWAVALMRFVLPFGLLLSRDKKMNPKRLGIVAVLILLGQLADLYWMIMPSLHKDGPVIGWQEIGPPLFFIGVIIFYVSVFLGRHKAVAEGDPWYAKSKDFHL